LEGAEESLFDEGAVEEGFGFEISGFESFIGGGGFVAAEAIKAPLNFGEPADVVRLGFADGGVVFVEASEECVEFGLIFAGKDNGFGEDSVFQGVLGRASLAFVGAGTGAELRIGPVGGVLFVRNHTSIRSFNLYLKKFVLPLAYARGSVGAGDREVE
jgi:hypothetical protein